MVLSMLVGLLQTNVGAWKLKIHSQLVDMRCDLADDRRHEASEALIELGVFCGGLSAPTGPHTMQLARIKKIVKRSVGEIVDNISRMSSGSGEVHVVFSKAIAEFTCCN